MAKLGSGDILGYRHTLFDELQRWEGGGVLNGHQQAHMEEMIHQFCDEYVKLDEWKRKSERTRLWSAHEPCMRPKGPGVVLAVSTVKIAVRVWTKPPMPVSNPVPGRLGWFEARNIHKIATEPAWQEWKDAMRCCGYAPEDWTTRAFEIVAGEMP